MMRVHVVVLNFNRRALTLRCLESLRRLDPAPASVIVVDNGSREQPGLTERDLPAGTMLLRLDQNLGYAGGNNAGIRAALAAGADAVWVLNNDTWVHAGALGALCGAFDAAGAGQRVLLPLVQDGPTDDLWFAGGSIDVARGQVRHDVERPRSGEPFLTSYAVGCCPFVPSDVLRDVGGFDQSLFLYWEDAEWTTRLLSRGVELTVVPAAVVAHEAGGTSVGGVSWRPFPRPYYKARNRLWLARRGLFSRWRTFAYTPRWAIRELRIEAREARVAVPVGATTSLLRGLVAGFAAPLPRARIQRFRDASTVSAPGSGAPRPTEPSGIGELDDSGTRALG